YEREGLELGEHQYTAPGRPRPCSFRGILPGEELYRTPPPAAIIERLLAQKMHPHCQTPAEEVVRLLHTTFIKPSHYRPRHRLNKTTRKEYGSASRRVHLGVVASGSQARRSF